MAYHFLHVLDKVIEVLMKYYGPSACLFSFPLPPFFFFLPNLNQLIKWLSWSIFSSGMNFKAAPSN